MKMAVVVAGLMLLGATGAGAANIAGKWGIGAGIFSNGGGELSLIRGRSERSAWLFEVQASQESRLERPDASSILIFLPGTETSDRILINAGPGYRRYARPSEDFSPYCDIAAHFVYYHAHQRVGSDAFTARQAGLDGVFSFGLEYFTRWRFSVAAHSEVAAITWTSDHESREFAIGTAATSGHTQRASIGLNPAIFIRGYF